MSAPEPMPSTQQVPADAPVTLPAPPPATAFASWPTVLGYELLAVLGRGAMGVVYKAKQTNLNRVVALKMILDTAHALPEEQARFRLDAEALAKLRHPHIVQVHEVGHADGKAYFSLEYVEGGNLAAKLDGTPWPEGKACALIETLARAVQHAHERGIIHRDLKPGNVLLLPDGTPKVTDFGLAKWLDDASLRQPASKSVQTQSGAILGTPSYMAPEQASGKNKQIGPPADVYALGAILYELLTGRPPFKGATILETLHLVCTHEPVPPRQLQPRLPRDVETICLKCLEKEAVKRYASATEFADDVGRFLRCEPIRARPIGKVERAWRWCRRNPTVAMLAATVTMLLVTIAVLGTLLAILYAENTAKLGVELQQQQKVAKAERERANAEEDKRKAEKARADAEVEKRNLEDLLAGRKDPIHQEQLATKDAEKRDLPQARQPEQKQPQPEPSRPPVVAEEVKPTTSPALDRELLKLKSEQNLKSTEWAVAEYERLYELTQKDPKYSVSASEARRTLLDPAIQLGERAGSDTSSEFKKRLAAIYFEDGKLARSPG